jgi:hypothetical protein
LFSGLGGDFFGAAFACVAFCGFGVLALAVSGLGLLAGLALFSAALFSFARVAAALFATVLFSLVRVAAALLFAAVLFSLVRVAAALFAAVLFSLV